MMISERQVYLFFFGRRLFFWVIERGSESERTTKRGEVPRPRFFLKRSTTTPFPQNSAPSLSLTVRVRWWGVLCVLPSLRYAHRWGSVKGGAGGGRVFFSRRARPIRSGSAFAPRLAAFPPHPRRPSRRGGRDTSAAWVGGRRRAPTDAEFGSAIRRVASCDFAPPPPRPRPPTKRAPPHAPRARRSRLFADSGPPKLPSLFTRQKGCFFGFPPLSPTTNTSKLWAAAKAPAAA